MTNLDLIFKNSAAGVETYIYDDFEKAVIKIVPAGSGEVWIKREGKPEYKIAEDTKLVFEIKQGGKIVDSEFYDKFK